MIPLSSWRSESFLPAPKKMISVDDSLKADEAYRLACEGTAMLWQGDFQNAKQLLQALTRRFEKRKSKKHPEVENKKTSSDLFHLHRQSQAQKARILNMILIPVEADYSIPLRRAPDVQQAFREVYDQDSVKEPFLISLREVLGFIGAHEWRKKGILIPFLGVRIFPFHGVFSPVRGEYLELIEKAELPATTLAFDIGTGTGVIAAILAKRGVQKIIATDMNEKALGCAQENIRNLKLEERVFIQKADLFPNEKAGLIVCNPPWIPARPTSQIEYAVYDEDSKMLRGFLNGLQNHLLPSGEAWLILSDIAEHLGLRTREELLSWIGAGGLKVLGRLDIQPRHRKAFDMEDPLHMARSKEITSLWRLAIQ